MMTAGQNRKLKLDNCKMWQSLFPFPCEMGSSLLFLLLYLKTAVIPPFVTLCCISPSSQQGTVMPRVCTEQPITEKAACPAA